VARSLADIGKTFANDRFDRSDGISRFMIWREEQRAIGEVSTHRDDDGEYRSVGFATFAENYAAGDRKWFANFVSDLETADAAKSKRLARVQGLLAGLVRQLDENARYSDEPPKWMRRATPAECLKVAAPRGGGSPRR
jgi:hypothetical protein